MTQFVYNSMEQPEAMTSQQPSHTIFQDPVTLGHRLINLLMPSPCGLKKMGADCSDIKASIREVYIASSRSFFYGIKPQNAYVGILS